MKRIASHMADAMIHTLIHLLFVSACNRVTRPCRHGGLLALPPSSPARCQAWPVCRPIP